MPMIVLTKVKTLLDKINTNGTAAIDPDVPKHVKGNKDRSDWIDRYKLIHEYYVFDFVRAWADKKREEVKKRIIATFNEELKPAVGFTSAATYHDYVLSKQIKSPGSRLDKGLLADALRKKGWKQADIDILITDSTKQDNPATVWSVTAIS